MGQGEAGARRRGKGLEVIEDTNLWIFGGAGGGSGVRERGMIRLSLGSSLNSPHAEGNNPDPAGDF